MNWVTLHMLGFFSFLGPAVLIELPIAVMELAESDGIQRSWEGDASLQNSRLVLAVMRALCAVLLLFAAPFLAKSKTRNANTLSALKWRAEFTVGEFGATQMYFNALSVWLQPGVGPYSWVDVAFLSLFAVEAFRIFFVHALWTLILMLFSYMSRKIVTLVLEMDAVCGNALVLAPVCPGFAGTPSTGGLKSRSAWQPRVR